MIAGRFITCALALGLWFAGAPPLRAESTLPLPTPHSHYETFPPGISGLPLLQNLVQGLDPQTQKTVLAFVGSARLLNQQATALSKEQALARLKQLNWNPWKPILLEFVVHQSQALEMLPVKLQASVYPIVHDSLLYFLDHLPDDRLLEKFVDIAHLPAGSSRSEALMAFVARTPSLQKIGQILARNQSLSAEYSGSARATGERDPHDDPR